MNLIMRLFSVPFFFLYQSMALFVNNRKAFSSMMQIVSLFPGISGEWIRRGVLQWVTGDRLENCCISFGCLFSDPELEIGSGVYFGPKCDIGNVKIDQDCIIGSGVYITSGLHQHIFHNSHIPIRDQGGSFTKIHIGADSWIGNAAVVSANIGSGCVIGAGSVVIDAIPDLAVAVGNPAKVVRYR